MPASRASPASGRTLAPAVRGAATGDAGDPSRMWDALPTWFEVDWNRRARGPESSVMSEASARSIVPAPSSLSFGARARCTASIDGSIRAGASASAAIEISTPGSSKATIGDASCRESGASWDARRNEPDPVADRLERVRVGCDGVALRDVRCAPSSACCARNAAKASASRRPAKRVEARDRARAPCAPPPVATLPASPRTSERLPSTCSSV